MLNGLKAELAMSNQQKTGRTKQAAEQLRLLADQLDQQLPQLQCGQCGYQGCRPYAEAIAASDAPTDRCVPGGPVTMQSITKLSLSTKPVNQIAVAQIQQVKIDETECVGCIKCIEVCPVDAIIGSRNQAHTVLAEWCTGCGLCLEVCPVDCISQVEATVTPTAAINVIGGLTEQTTPIAQQLRQRYLAKNLRPSLFETQVGEVASVTEMVAAAKRRTRRRRG